MDTPRFQSLEEERAYYTAEAERYKTSLHQQVLNVQQDTVATAKKSLLWGGAYALCFGIARTLLGTHKHTVNTPDGPASLKEKESLLASAAKGAALLGLGVVAARAAQQYLAHRTATPHAQDPSLEPDTTEL